MREDGAPAPDASQPIDLESREMSVLAKHKAAVLLVGAFAILIGVGVLTS